MDKNNHTVSILIADDRPENLLALQAILNSSEYNLVKASSGKEVLKLINSHEFAVILLDVQMPDLDGFETAFFIRRHQNGKTTPIIFITAGSESDQRVYKGYEAGAIDYLIKPFDPLILQSKVKYFVEFFRAKKEVLHQSELIRNHEEQERNSFLEKAMDGVIGLNEQGNIIYWNLQAWKIFGWSKDEVLGKSLLEFVVPPKQRLDFQNGLQNFLKTGLVPFSGKRIEVSAIRKSGEEFPVELSATPILQRGKTTFSAFVRDISQEKQIEAERKSERELLLKSEIELKAAILARDEIISICSHELKTPVTSMKLQFQLAIRQMEKGNFGFFAKKESLEKIIYGSNNQLDRMVKLIDDMLDISRLSAGKLSLEIKPLNLVTLVHDVLDKFSNEFSSLGLKVTFEPFHPEVIINGDQYRLEQVINNLITNAIRYGGQKPFSVSVGVINDIGYCKIVDHGIGIEEKNLTRVFERYERETTSPAIRGLGLGLFISKQIVLGHTGNILVSSKKDEGSTFTVELPLAS